MLILSGNVYDFFINIRYVVMGQLLIRKLVMDRLKSNLGNDTRLMYSKCRDPNNDHRTFHVFNMFVSLDFLPTFLSRIVVIQQHVVPYLIYGMYLVFRVIL